MALASSALTSHYWSPIQELLHRDTIADIYIDRFDRVYFSAEGQRHAAECRWDVEARSKLTR
jgi:hypothetical protein